MEWAPWLSPSEDLAVKSLCIFMQFCLLDDREKELKGEKYPIILAVTLIFNNSNIYNSYNRHLGTNT
jgi:hypothetical protein